MDLQKAKINLDKINALFRNMNADARNISTIEKDLMRSYVRQFYEAFLEMPASPPVAPPAEEFVQPAPKMVPPKPEPAPPPPPAPKPEPVAEQPKPAPPPPPEPVAKAPAEPAPAAQPPAHPQPVAPAAPDGELEELFTIALAKELSEKLGELPITDIRKAMGLNERIFTMNELFGGDQAAFDETLASLNRLSGFEEAKNYLIHGAASRFNWASKDKKSKARNFIKLVKRRYN